MECPKCGYKTGLEYVIKRVSYGALVGLLSGLIIVFLHAKFGILN